MMMCGVASGDDTQRGLRPAGQRDVDRSGGCGGGMRRGAAGAGRKSG